MLCWMCMIFSPFVGFSIHGKVTETGLETGLRFALFPLAGIVFLMLSRWRAWRRLPPHVAEEWRSGRLVPATGAPAVVPPIRFVNGKERIELLAEGVVVAQETILSISGVPDLIQKIWIADQLREIFVPWSDITEWVVDTSIDGPDYYLLQLRGVGAVKVGRLRILAGSESDLLDAVRSIGKLPVRVRCDVD